MKGKDLLNAVVSEIAAGALMAPDGSPVYAVSSLTLAPSDGRPLLPVVTIDPGDGRPVFYVSTYAAGTLMTPDGRPVHAVSGLGFNPASLFAASDAGAWYDPSDLSSMYQDSAGTTAAVVGQPVGKLNDKSGNANHAIMGTAALRPILRQDTGGKYYLEFDGVDDYLRATFTIAQPWDRVSALRQTTWTSGDFLFGGVTANAGVLFETGATPQINIFDGTVGPASTGLAVGANGVITERHDGLNSRLAVNNAAYVVGNTGITLPGGLTIAATTTGGSAANIRFYGTTMIGRALTDAEIANLRSYMAGKAGVTL